MPNNPDNQKPGNQINLPLEVGQNLQRQESAEILPEESFKNKISDFINGDRLNLFSEIERIKTKYSLAEDANDTRIRDCIFKEIHDETGFVVDAKIDKEDPMHYGWYSTLKLQLLSSIVDFKKLKKKSQSSFPSGRSRIKYTGSEEE